LQNLSDYNVPHGQPAALFFRYTLFCPCKASGKTAFSDPSLACALLRATPSGLLSDLEPLGFLFEALCERDLRIYAEAFGAGLYHYQDYRNREIDAVIELPDGRWCAFEIKLGANRIDEAAENLKKIRNELAKEEKAVPLRPCCASSADCPPPTNARMTFTSCRRRRCGIEQRTEFS
jgi:hypothetical protein